MEIIPLIQEFTNTFNKTFHCSLNPFNLESKIRDVGDSFTIKLYEQFLTHLDTSFKKSNVRKDNYYVKETTKKTLITSVGSITIPITSYYSKETKERFVFIRSILNLKPYQRLTNEAEYQLIKYAMEENMNQASRHALRNTIVSRSTVSKKMAKLHGSIKETISKANNQPDVLYIEMDEIHANLQHGGNRICPCAIVHEGHKEEFANRKQLKNVRNFASATLSYEELWEVIYDYVDKKYNIDKLKVIFVSGDGAAGIKNFNNCFPNAIFVLDKFHYFKALRYIFKNNSDLLSIADSYLRNNNITDFNILVDCQIKKQENSAKYIRNKANYLINNIEGIKNQDHSLYKCPCAMEGHVSNSYARYITSSPFGFSEIGLNNKLKLLVYKANKHDLTIEDYYNLKYGSDISIEINDNIKKLTNIKYDQSLSSNHSFEYDFNTLLPSFYDNALNNQLYELTSIRQEIYII